VIKLRLSPDYTPPDWVPLWPSSDYTEALVPAELLPRLVAWQDQFIENFDVDRGWRSEEVMEQWAAEGYKLAAELESAMRGQAELKVDFWPLRRGGHS
jgi:hypothetical protein